jgi:hypothetical protein
MGAWMRHYLRPPVTQQRNLDRDVLETMRLRDYSRDLTVVMLHLRGLAAAPSSIRMFETGYCTVQKKLMQMV